MELSIYCSLKRKYSMLFFEKRLSEFEGTKYLYSGGAQPEYIKQNV